RHRTGGGRRHRPLRCPDAWRRAPRRRGGRACSRRAHARRSGASFRSCVLPLSSTPDTIAPPILRNPKDTLMDMKFTPEQLAFREEVRAFIKEKLPEDIRRKVAQGLELNRDDHQRWMRILAEKGWLATNWEKKDGGPGWTV